MNNNYNFKDFYDFKILEMDVFHKNETEIKYILLIDSITNFIYDYKIEFKKLKLRLFTTPSHQKTKSKNSALILRMRIFDILKIKHSFAENKKIKKLNLQEHYHLNSNEINKLNLFLKSYDLKNITFQNIEYIINGSNPSGQGSGKAYLYTKIKNKEYALGFLLQSINKCKSQKWSNYIQKQEWNDFIENKWIHLSNKNNVTNFEDLLEQDSTLSNYFYSFNYFPKDWKKNKENLYKTLLFRKNSEESFKKIIQSKRNEYKKNIESKFESNLNNLIQLFFKSETNVNFEYAHIKPVFLIKKEFISSSNNLNILDEISDPNNFLPLPIEIHRYYDDKNLYWDINGNMIVLNDEKIPNSYIEFQKINKTILNNSIKKYLEEYKNWLEKQ